jgi:lysine 2,3-aminomutase
LIAATGGNDGPIGIQFVAQPEKERLFYNDGLKDPLMEDEHEVSPGLVYKYQAEIATDGTVLQKGRALFTITRNCAAYCRFCTRGREVGISANNTGVSEVALAHSPHLSREQIDESLAFISREPGLNEVILSGGDPLTVKPDILKYTLGKLGDLQRSGKLDIVRIGTRVPIHNPLMFKDYHIEAIKQLEIPRMMLHINHPAEITPEMLQVVKRLRYETGANLYSQSVLLSGVNDSVSVLQKLFEDLAKNGIHPYYVFQNDKVYWADHFTVPLDEAMNIWGQLRPRLSGVAATAKLVIDVPKGHGKIPVPEGNAWSIDRSAGYRDFKGTVFSLNNNQS